jgi:hypothetical protein
MATPPVPPGPTPPVIASAPASGAAVGVGESKGRWWDWGGPLLILVALVVLWQAEPRGQAFYPRCMLYAATGLQCPGCGGLRAIHALLNGHPLAAWRLNPLVFFVAPAALWTGIVHLARWSGRRWPNPFLAPWLIGAFGGIAFVFGVLRNFPAFGGR